MKTYKFHEDPGHGWLEVPVADVHALGILSKITGYSYRGKNEQGVDCLFLEEDCDFSTFYEAIDGKEKFDFVRINHPYEAPCRNFRHFQP
jgi:hypothetical protein